jgi:hypothetical protein
MRVGDGRLLLVGRWVCSWREHGAVRSMSGREVGVVTAIAAIHRCGDRGMGRLRLRLAVGVWHAREGIGSILTLQRRECVVGRRVLLMVLGWQISKRSQRRRLLLAARGGLVVWGHIGGIKVTSVVHAGGIWVVWMKWSPHGWE